MAGSTVISTAGWTDPNPAGGISVSVSGGARNTSTPRLRIARETSPRLGSSARNRRKFGCAVMTLGSPSRMPHSLTRSDPPISRSGLSRSSTVGEHKLAFSRSTHSPRTAALSRTPSTHSKRPAAGAAPPQASGPRRAARARSEAIEPSTPSRPSSIASSSASSSRAPAATLSVSIATSAASSAALAASASSTLVLSADASMIARYLDQAAHADSVARVASSFESSASPRAVSAVVAGANASAAEARSAASASASIVARSRADSFCSNEPRSSDVSVAAVSATCLSVRPARLANVCTSDVLPLAGGPTTMVIHPRAAQCAAASNAPSCPRRRPKGVSFSTFAEAPPHGNTACPTRSAPSRIATAGDFGGVGGRPNADANNSAHSARSAAVRSRRTNSVAKVASTARSAASIASSTSVCVRPFESTESGSSAAAVAAAASIKSHHRNKSRRLNSHGAPALAKVPPETDAAAESAAVNATMRSTTVAGMRG